MSLLGVDVPSSLEVCPFEPYHEHRQRCSSCCVSALRHYREMLPGTRLRLEVFPPWCLRDGREDWSARIALESSGKEQVYSSTRGWGYSSCISAVDKDVGVTLI
jgi:hypothetical protein